MACKKHWFIKKKKEGAGRAGLVIFFCVSNCFANVKHLRELTAENRFEKPVQPDQLE